MQFMKMQFKIPKLRQLRALLAVARAGRVAKAASTLNVSQPAVTRAIQSLEKEIGVLMFERTRERMVLTRLGSIVVERAERAFDHLTAAENEMRRLSRSSGPAISATMLTRFVTNHELNAVITIGDVHSVTSAAASLGVSQPAVNRSLRNIEQRMNLRLFDRTSRGMLPTDCGEILIRRAKLAFLEIRQAMEEIASLSGDAKGRISIGSLPLPRTYLIPTAVSRFLEEFPNATVSIYDGVYEKLLADLCAGDIDMILGTLRDPVPIEGTTSEVLFEDGMIIAARSDHPLFEKSNLSFEDIRDARWVMPHQGVPLRRQFEEQMRANGLPVPEYVIETDSTVVIRTLLLDSDRLAVVSENQIYEAKAQGLLAPLPLQLDVRKRKIGAVIRTDYVPTPAVNTLMKYLRAVGAEIGKIRE
jgi:LysR family transcriptional regulator of gallate degradation